MRWAKDHALLIVITFIAILVFISSILFRRRDKISVDSLIKEISLEKKVIDAKASAAKLLAERSKNEVAAMIQKQHEEAIARMDEADKKKVEDLLNDPEALTEHLLRITI